MSQVLFLQDVVLLQEVFVRADVSMLIASAGTGSLAHAHFFNAGMLHGELLILSQHPILEVFCPPYEPHTASPEHIHALT